jgi:hypothetical protein
VLFAGICRVHRSQVLEVTGEWDRAEAEAARVCTDLGRRAGWGVRPMSRRRPAP